MPEESAEPLLTERQLAEQLQLSQSTLRWWRSEKRGPPWIVLNGGRSIRYRPEDVREWLLDYRCEP